MANKILSREELLEAGRIVLDQAVHRLENRYISKGDRLALMRVVASIIPALSSVLKDTELEDLDRRLSRLEETQFVVP